MAKPASRRRCQKKVRKGHVDMIVKNMSAKLRTKMHYKRMCATDRLLPMGTLRRKCVKRLFTPWAFDLVGQGRVLTHKLCDQVVKRLRNFFQLGPLDEGAETEVKTLHRLIKHARKRKLGGARISAMSSMDLLETIPMEFPADDIPQDCMVVCFLCTHIKRRMHKLFNASLDCLRFLDQSPFAQLLPRHTARTTSTMARSPMPMITVQQWPMRLMDSGLNGIYSGHFKSMGPPSVTNSKCLN